MLVNSKWVAAEGPSQSVAEAAVVLRLWTSILVDEMAVVSEVP